MLIYSKLQDSFINLTQLLEVLRDGTKIVAVSAVKDQDNLFIAKTLAEYETEEKAKKVLKALVDAYVSEKRLYALPLGLEQPSSGTGAPLPVANTPTTNDSAPLAQAP